MKIIRFIFNLRTVYFKQTRAQILYLYFWIILAVWFAGLIGQSYHVPPYILVVVAIVLAYALLRTIIRTVLVNRYIRQYPESLLVVPPAEVASASVNLELDKIDALKPIAVYKNARLFLATCNFYTRTKHGDFLAKQAYYNVLEVQLKRRLPHILFDNKQAKRRQFKSLYLQAQRVSVQAPFDEVFDTYVPQTYVIDSLSFITPEVMELMMEANCDIEIINDKLLLYAPLLHKEDLELLSEKGRDIAKQLNDNIDTYRDDRLTGSERTTNITLFARSLLKSPKKNIIIASLLGLTIVALLISSLVLDSQYRDDILLNQISLLIYISFLTNVWSAGKIMRENHKAWEGYRILYQTNRGKPIKPTIS